MGLVVNTTTFSQQLEYMIKCAFQQYTALSMFWSVCHTHTKSAPMDFAAPIWQLQQQLVQYQSQLEEIEKKLKESETTELQELARDIREIITAYKEVLQSKGVAIGKCCFVCGFLWLPFVEENGQQNMLQKERQTTGYNKPIMKPVTKKARKSKGRKEEALKERVASWQQFHSKHGARRKSIFQSPEEGSRTRVGFQG